MGLRPNRAFVSIRATAFQHDLIGGPLPSLVLLIGLDLYFHHSFLQITITHSPVCPAKLHFLPLINSKKWLQEFILYVALYSPNESLFLPHAVG